MRAIKIVLLSLIFAAAVQSQDALRVDVNLVNVFATVHDANGEFVSGLSASDFRVFDDGVEQQIAVFETEGVESAVAILLDNSGSMVDILPPMKAGTLEFARKAGRLDDVTVYSFGTAVRLIHDFADNDRNLPSRMETLRAYGTSAMFDAIKEASQKLQDREETRKAIIVFSDGNDNGSQAGFRDVQAAAQRSGALIYFVAIGSRILIDDNTIEALAADSGGRVIYMPKTGSVPEAIDSIRTELAKQYYLGYYVAPRPGAHKIRVEIPARPGLRIRAKTGYLG